MVASVRVLVVLILTLLDGSSQAWASDASIRIGFLLNFGRFTEWPDATLGATQPMTICLAPGDEEMEVEIGAVERQMIQNRPVRALKVKYPGELSRCQIVYLPLESPVAVKEWLAAAERAATLTVSDRPDFNQQGGMIELVQVTDRYRFDINLAATKQANLRLSTNLLKLARSVK